MVLSGNQVLSVFSSDCYSVCPSKLVILVWLTLILPCLWSGMTQLAMAADSFNAAGGVAICGIPAVAPYHYYVQDVGAVHTCYQQLADSWKAVQLSSLDVHVMLY